MKIISLISISLLLIITGCAGPISLHRAVINYDETIINIERELLLINIARTHQNIPSHFTVTSRIAATFDFQTNTGFIGNIFERLPGINTYSFNLGASAAENPTLSIIPIQGEEFTKRILTPMDESKFQFLLIQGAPIDMVMRLMARGIEIQNKDGSFNRFILNWPIRPEEYKEFRKIALHLAWLNYNRELFIGRINYEDSITIESPDSLSAIDHTEIYDKGYRLKKEGKNNTSSLVKSINGRVAITNYDLHALTNDEKKAIDEFASSQPGNFVYLDIREGYPGGDYPILGAIKLRSFNEIIEFLATGIDKTPEFDVDFQTYSENISANPSSTLDIIIDKSIKSEVLKISYNGHVYSIKDTLWNREAFKLLYQLFQMTVTDVSALGIPITISK